MKILNYINQVIALIFNTINLLTIGITALAQVGSYYYDKNLIDTTILKNCDSYSIRGAIIFFILSLIYVTLNYIFNLKGIKKGMIALTIIGSIITILSLFIPLY